MPTLYISDLDGTLLSPDITITAYTARVAGAFIARGGLFTYATARSHRTASALTRSIHWNLPVITYNGTFIVNAQTGERLIRHVMPKDAVSRLLEVILSAGHYPLVYAFIDGVESVSYVRGRGSRGVRGYVSGHKGDKRLRPVEDAAGLLAGEVFYMTMIDGEQAIAALMAQAERVPGIRAHTLEDTYTPGEHWLELASAASGKDTALLALKEQLGADKVVVFGDNLNDMAMFRVADEGYAVAGAQAALKAIATGIIGSNAEDGVARFLETR